MIAWALDTLVWTGAAIVVVLMLRRPFARAFGPRFAYALWLLPVVRLLLPEIVLPVAPAPAIISVGKLAPVAQPSNFGPDLAGTLITIWLAGAALVLAWRLSSYFLMRRRLLAGARIVSGAGRVRIVQTSRTVGPVAFGIFDPVVALPHDFMTVTDRTQRKLAIEHELAHHRGGDLVVNLLVQPLFALHWFTPLGWLGWNALRCDQEAACDARVLARCGSGSRAAYAELIASYAARPKHTAAFAMAAAMACPVLGAPSIVHRLRSLTMTEIPRSRRYLGLAVLACLGCTLTLTATISYAMPAPVAPVAATSYEGPERADAARLARPVEPAPAPPPVAAPAVPEISEAQSADSEEAVRLVEPNRPGDSGFDAFKADAENWIADAKKRMDEARARNATVDRTSAVSDIFQRTVNGVPVRTIDCKAFRAGEAEANDSLAARVCSTEKGFGSFSSLSFARSLIARDTSLSDIRKSDLLADIDSAIAESGAARQ